MKALNTVIESGLIAFKEGDTGHDLSNELVKTQYAKHFKCDLRHFMPESINLFEAGELVACTGFRHAAKESLFLEQYLDSPIEDCLFAQTNKKISREEIVEIGGFALSNSSFALSFMFQLAPLFKSLGFTTAVCSVTSPVSKYLSKLGIDSVCLADADPKKVDTSDNAWGNYYDLKPLVLAGNIDAAINKIEPFRAFLSK